MGFFERYLTVWVFLCIVVSALIAVPVMLMVTNFVNRSRAWHETRPGIGVTTNAARQRAFIRRRSDRRKNQTYL